MPSLISLFLFVMACFLGAIITLIAATLFLEWFEDRRVTKIQARNLKLSEEFHKENK